MHRRTRGHAQGARRAVRFGDRVWPAGDGGRAQSHVLAAGDPAAIDRVQPLFDALGKKTWRLGDEPRQSNVAKIAGNLMVACMIEAMSEAAALSRAYELAPTDVLDVVVGSLFDVPSIGSTRG